MNLGFNYKEILYAKCSHACYLDFSNTFYMCTYLLKNAAIVLFPSATSMINKVHTTFSGKEGACVIIQVCSSRVKQWQAPLNVVSTKRLQ